MPFLLDLEAVHGLYSAVETAERCSCTNKLRIPRAGTENLHSRQPQLYNHELVSLAPLFITLYAIFKIDSFIAIV